MRNVAITIVFFPIMVGVCTAFMVADFVFTKVRKTSDPAKG